MARTTKTYLIAFATAALIAASQLLPATDGSSEGTAGLPVIDVQAAPDARVNLEADHPVHLLLTDPEQFESGRFSIVNVGPDPSDVRLEAYDASGALLLVEYVTVEGGTEHFIECSSLPEATASVALSAEPGWGSRLQVSRPAGSSMVLADKLVSELVVPEATIREKIITLYNPSDDGVVVTLGSNTAVEALMPNELMTVGPVSDESGLRIAVTQGSPIYVAVGAPGLSSKNPYPASGAIVTYPFLCGGTGSGNESMCGANGNYTTGLIHLGQDIDSSRFDDVTDGNRVFSTLPGTIVSAESKVTCIGCEGLGNNVVVRHVLNDGRVVHSRYGHLLHYSDAQAAGLVSNDTVVGGQFLGYKGSTGMAFGTHLHFEIDKDGQVATGSYLPCASHWTPPCVGNARTSPATSSTLAEDPSNYRNGNRAPLIPYFSIDSNRPIPSAAAYDVYGIAGKRLYAALPFTQSSNRPWLVGGRNEAGAIVDILLPTNSGDIKAGYRDDLASDSDGIDYRFSAWYDGIPSGGGYPVKLTVLPDAGSKIVDNDSASGFQGSENEAGSSDLVAGYFYSATIFKSSAGQFASWKPSLSSGRYGIWIHVPRIPYGTKAGSVRYKIYTSSSATPLLSDPISHGDVNGNKWVRLITSTQDSWTFDSTGYVGLSIDQSGGNSGIAAGSLVGVDAVKFITMAGRNMSIKMRHPGTDLKLARKTPGVARRALRWRPAG